MSLPINKAELQPYFDSEEFVIKTCQQISKDLTGLIDIEPNFNLDVQEDVLSALTDQLASILNRMDSANVQQFIYRVDLREEDYVKNVSKEDEGQSLAYFVIRREAQKVYLRSKFS